MMFDDILADCIDALEQGATIKECLARYPAHATALEPLLRLVIPLSHESQTRLSAPAFLRGRQQVMAQAHQRRAPRKAATAQHRQSVSAPGAPAQRHVHPAFYSQNGAPRLRRSRIAKRAGWRLAMPRLFQMALLLMMLLGATTFFRQMITSLPGTTFYPVKSTGTQLIGVLMEAAGEGIPWHATQTEQRLQELARLANPDRMTVQTLSQVVERHWEALLVASESLPAPERTVLLQERLTRLRQLEATWTTAQANAPQAAVTTVRKLITAGEEALGHPQPLATPTAVVVTVTTTATPTAPALPATSTLTMTPTPLLQASATAATSLPVLVPSATPTASPTVEATTGSWATPTAAIPSPTTPVSAPPATPLPEITAQMPQQEASSQEEDDHNDTDHAAAPEVATPSPATEQPAEVTPLPSTETATPAAGDLPATLEPTVTVATTETSPATVPANQTPPATVPVENTAVAPTKTTPSALVTAGATPEPPATGTARPTNQATATKTPKPTATPANGATATPDSAISATPPPPTAIEKTPSATTQPRDEATPTPSALVITPVLSQPLPPRPTTPGGEATKVAP